MRSLAAAIVASPLAKAFAVLSVGLAIAMFLALGGSADGKIMIVVLALLAGLSALPIVLYFGSLAETGYSWR